MLLQIIEGYYFFRSFALMQKNQKIKSGNPQLKNDIFF